MRRKRPFSPCKRRWVPRRLRADIVLRQEGRCADCGTRLIIGFFVFDHRPPLALREAGADPNDPDGLAAICTRCDETKTPKDLKEIARTKRLAVAHQDFIERKREKVPGRRAPSQREWEALERSLGRSLAPRLEAIGDPNDGELG
jgi:5-methylcytosine-specific restriction endonuclease McrA